MKMINKILFIFLIVFCLISCNNKSNIYMFDEPIKMENIYEIRILNVGEYNSYCIYCDNDYYIMGWGLITNSDRTFYTNQLINVNNKNVYHIGNIISNTLSIPIILIGEEKINNEENVNNDELIVVDEYDIIKKYI